MIPRKSDTSAPQTISLRGVRVHNLKSVDVDIPRGRLVAVCGVSGSGKTSLAIDTLYAEGQRRYIESFSAYTRQFLQRLDKPDFDRIDGLPPALAVTRGSTPRGNRSTVGTASETLDYLRLLFAKVAAPVCFGCGHAVHRSSPQSVAQWIKSLPNGKLMVGFETSWENVTDRASLLADLQGLGFVRLLVGNQTLNLGQDSRQELAAALPERGKVWVIVDRLRGGDSPERTTESLETCFEQGLGQMAVLLDASHATSEASMVPGVTSPPTYRPDSGERMSGWLPVRFARQLRCMACGIDYPDPEPRLFSFNSPLGACPTCEGFGDTIDLDMDLVVPDKRKTIREGAVAPWNTPAHRHNLDELLDIADEIGIPVDVPFRKLTKSQVRTLIEGQPQAGFPGLNGFFGALERKKYKMHVRVFLSRWRSYHTCATCDGARLNALALAFQFAGKNFAQLCELEVDQLLALLTAWESEPIDVAPQPPSAQSCHVVADARHAAGAKPDMLAAAAATPVRLSQTQKIVAADPLDRVKARLGYLQSVGLGYLTLNRTLRTLSGGEVQRTALTSALGSSLVNMLYVLDEPSVGLHPHDVRSLAAAIERLAHRGNTVVMIEHEEALLECADHLIEVGPEAGAGGGEIVFAGSRTQFEHSTSLTADYISGRRRIPVPVERRGSKGTLRITGCRGHNLQSIDVDFPLGVLCLVTGVSGSGKSSLVQDTLYAALANRLTSQTVKPLAFDDISGTGLLDDCVLVDQSPISRSPRSNPITYIKAFDEVRKVFAETLDARTHNYSASHFSFNSELGRCPRCQGDGMLQIDMQFLADVYMTCGDCGGDRYRPEILSVRYRDRNIADVLHMTVREAQHFFRGATKVQNRLKVLSDVGLDYLQLGQSATTLSSGEAQRLKLAAYLASSTHRRTLFILDEPTTGLHTHDILKLLDCFDALLAAGHSLLVVEHNLHLMAAADHIVDIGPGAAQAGGRLVCAGTPEQVAACEASLTGSFLRTAVGTGP